MTRLFHVSWKSKFEDFQGEMTQFLQMNLPLLEEFVHFCQRSFGNDLNVRPLCFHRARLDVLGELLNTATRSTPEFELNALISQVVNTFIRSVGIQGVQFCFGQLAVNLYSPLHISGL